MIGEQQNAPAGLAARRKMAAEADAAPAAPAAAPAELSQYDDLKELLDRQDLKIEALTALVRAQQLTMDRLLRAPAASRVACYLFRASRGDAGRTPRRTDQSDGGPLALDAGRGCRRRRR